MEHLAEAETQRARARHGQPPVFSAHNEVRPSDYQGEVSGRIAQELRDAGRLCLDASDVMPPTIGRVLYEKVIEFLADPDQEPIGLLREIQQVQNELPDDTPWLDQACGG
jgi:alpha-glucoside transport system substrate-binding protein